MRRVLAAALALVLALLLCACGDFVSILPGTELPVSDGGTAGTAEEESFAETDLFSFLGWGGFGQSYYNDTPVALSYQTASGEGGVRGCRAYVFDRASIIAACDALRGMTVTGRAEQAPGSEAEYTLTMPGGTEYAVSFGVSPDGARVLRAYTGDYTVTGGEGLWDIEFPAYSGRFDVFDLYFDEGVRAFADDFYENTPVSVGCRLSSGATITSEDPATVERVFRALAGASVTVVENRPDQNLDLSNVRDYIFTLPDGSTRAFSFADRCLAVTASAAFGPVYYWLDGVDALWDISITSDTAEVFEGGPITELREELQTVAEIVNGERDDLRVAGVFVEYTLDGESAYLTLSDDVAYSFLRTLCAVRATGETAAEPEGDRIAVSVTLSDLTGPMVYFTGDSIQQVVGVNYLCDSGDMQALRQAIRELADGGNNTAEIEDTTTD